MSSNKKQKTKTARNAPCPCGSGKKFKRCCANDAKDAKSHLQQPSPSSQNTLKMSQLTGVLVFIIVFTVTAYWAVLGYGFVNHDDIIYVTNNPYVQQGLTVENIAWAFTSTEGANWHPLTWISHMLDVSMYGHEDAAGHHLTNLILHIANACLLFVLLVRLTGRPVPSALVAVFFALHPMHVESVAWISERKDVLSTLFGLLTLLSYQRFIITQRTSSYISMLLFYCCGLMSKPMLVSLPVIMILLDFWPLQRYSIVGAGGFKPVISNLAKNCFLSLKNKIPLFIAALASGIMTLVAQGGSGAIGSVEKFSIATRLANTSLSYVTYIGKTLWPLNLSVFYPYRDSIAPWQSGLALMCLLLVTVLVLKAWRKAPSMTIGWFWFVIALIPVIGIIQVGEQAMADRYTYIPHIGLFILVFFGAADLLKPPIIASKLWLVPVFLAIVACFMLTHQQVRTWQDTVSLFSNAVSIHPQNAFAQYALGGEYLRRGELAKAKTHLHRSMEIDNDSSGVYEKLGLVHARQGESAEALEYFLEAKNRTASAGPLLLQNLGVAYRDNDRLDEAESTLREALVLTPMDSKIHYNLGVVQFRSGQYPQARDNLQQSLEILQAPQRTSNLARAALNYNSRAAPPRVHLYLGLVYEKLEQFEPSLKHFQAAYKLDSNNMQIPVHLARVHHNYGASLVAEGNLTMAAEEFRKAIGYIPGFEESKQALQKIEEILKKE